MCSTSDVDLYTSAGGIVKGGLEGGLLECTSLSDFALFFSLDVNRHRRSMMGLKQNNGLHLRGGCFYSAKKEKEQERNSKKILVITALNSDMTC